MYIEENIKTNVIKEFDVAVCGGGFAGISAALAAARQGKKVVLFEKQFMLGGLGTAGIVTIFLPLCDVTGQAAGTAAAMTDDFSALDVNELQDVLKNNGVVIHEKEII